MPLHPLAGVTAHLLVHLGERAGPHLAEVWRELLVFR